MRKHPVFKIMIRFPFLQRYLAEKITLKKMGGSMSRLSSVLAKSSIELNPHQVYAALYAFNSPLQRGAILADEVGLGKTIEAGLVISQKWAERKRKMLLIVPSNLRKQWMTELQEKFFLPSIILEAKSFNKIVKDGNGVTLYMWADDISEDCPFDCGYPGLFEEDDANDQS